MGKKIRKAELIVRRQRSPSLFKNKVNIFQGTKGSLPFNSPLYTRLSWAIWLNTVFGCTIHF